MAGLGAGVVLLLSTVIATPTPQSPLGEAKSATRCGGREAVNETLSELMEDYFQWKLHTYPEWATLEVRFWFEIIQCSLKVNKYWHLNITILSLSPGLIL